MKQLSSTLSKPRRRLYGLLIVGLLSSFVAAGVGGLIVFLGYSSPDVTVPFWECGQYVLALGAVNLGLYAAAFWYLGRLTRREGRRAAGKAPATPAAGDSGEPTESAPGNAPAPEQLPPVPPRVSRQVRGTASSLRLEP